MFTITDSELAFYKKFDVPPPTLSPDERRRLRYLFRNERCYYRRACDLTGKPIISIYHPQSPLKVYAPAAWWSDAWDPRSFGRDYDFSRGFFKQYADLAAAVPRPAIQNIKSENCEYTNYSAENKNCYLLVGSLRSEDCYYSYRIFYSKDIVDCYDLYASELCYECFQSRGLYNCNYCQNCQDSSDLVLCENCSGCGDCFGSVNLRNKHYYIFNEPYSRENYFKKRAELMADFADAKRRFEELRLRSPHKYAQIINCENSSGDELVDCKNCVESFVLKKSEECGYVCFGSSNKDCYDANHADNCQLQYNATNLEQNYNVMCANLAWYVNDAAYVTLCFNSKNLFGCVGMKKNEYCILNKQYSPREYEEVRARIVAQMKAAGEWGNYFPASLSPFGYNETLAQDDFSLTREEALAKGFKWRE